MWFTGIQFNLECLCRHLKTSCKQPICILVFYIKKDQRKEMMKAMPFFYSPPPKSDKNKDTRSKASTSSESELDSVSLESSTDDSPHKGNMTSGNQGRDSEEFEVSPLEISGMKKKHKGLRKKLVNALFDMTGMKSREKPKFKEPQKEESQSITADQIRLLIQEQKFMEASQHLLVMERGANGGDSEGKTEEEKMDDWNEIEDLLGLLKQEVLTIVRCSISIAQSQPELLRNAVRAIVDQVKEDEKSVSEEKSLEKTVCSRPRKWKEDWRNSVQVSVNKRMEVPPFDGNAKLSTTANSFLHMGNTMKKDLITVVQNIKPHYPEHFQVCSTYAEFYYNCFSSQLETIAQFELGKKDTYLLLSWVQNFYPNQIKHNPDLGKELEGANLGSLLPPRQIKQLEATYLANEVDSLKRWLTQCLKVEALRWTEGMEPVKLHGYFHSELSIDVIQAIHGAQKRAEEITLELGKNISHLLMSEFSTFLQSYKKELDSFIKENKQQPYFEATIIANINNSLSFWTHAKESTTSAQDYIKTKIFTTLNEIQNIGFTVLLQGLFQQLEPLFKTFTQKKWISCDDVMDEIIATTSRYISTFRTLKDPLYQAVMEKIHLHLVREHITRLLKKKVSLRSPEQQITLSDLVQKNAFTLQTFCILNESNATWLNAALPSLAEIIRLQDINAIMVEVGALAHKYPDISKKHLSSILYIKGNLSYSEQKSILNVLDIAEYATLPPALLFSAIKVS
nr:PREDICTED: tumor necrosis factor alpha-induced protein 2 isoform X2 [Anolis carolinensis]|eukprot:XP_008113945.1 PREDICTED: tumor necrosis factor alpha-induced protein 2 isoform X2 [Anolis carolinensis]